MSLQETTSAQRVHIGFFGVRNAGKSSLVNAVTGQNLAVVSDEKGTTTDPVRKAMELLPLGPVLIIDTPGFDDVGELGAQRVEKTKEILRKTDVAVLVVDISQDLNDTEKELISIFQEHKVPYIIARNKADLISEDATEVAKVLEVAESEGNNPAPSLAVSALKGTGIHALKEMIAKLGITHSTERKIVSDLTAPGDWVVLVVPIDESAPKGRIILPQQQTLRELLDAQCMVSVCQPQQLAGVLASSTVKPRLVITDSQAFQEVAGILPDDISLTSFSILFARYKGELDVLTEGASQLRNLVNGDKVLISEGCTHHRQCNDIGTVKLPKWMESYTGAKLDFSFTSGTEYPEDLSEYKVCVHCGGCMLNQKEMEYRLQHCKEADVPVVNYGIAIAAMNGILDRSLECFRQPEEVM